jgi:hypothetical protein
MKKILLLFAIPFSLIIFSNFNFMAQTTLLDPTGAGGFELGPDMASNGWTEINSAQSFFVGSAPVQATGNNCAYTSTANGSWTASTASSVAHIYRDISVPAGEPKISISLKYKISAVDATFDFIKVHLIPVSTTPVAGTQLTVGQVGVNTDGTTSYATYNFVTAVTAGTSYRLVISFKNDAFSPYGAAALDDISVISSAPGDFISITNGNWNDPLTWDANAVPTAADNATVSTGHLVTANATGQGINNLIVNGTFAYGTTPTQFNVNGNLTINNGGLVNVFFNTTGKTLFVSGNILNDGVMNFSVGGAGNSATGASILNLNGSSVQTISGTGSFTNNKIGSLTCSNTSNATPNINWQFDNIIIQHNLNLTGARFNLGSLTLSHGSSFNTTTGSMGLTSPNGTGFLPGAKYRRWFTTAATGSTITAGSDPTSTSSRYPFLTDDGTNQRWIHINRSSSSTTGNTAGYLAVVYSDANSSTTGLSIVDGTYTITDRYDGNWTITAEEGYVYASGTHRVAISANNAYSPLNGNSRVMLANQIAGGSHQNGTVTPTGQRIGLTTDSLTMAPLYLGIASTDNQYPCAGTPLIPTINASALSLCQGVNDTLTATGLAVNTLGLSYQWQKSTTAGSGYTNISGATGISAILNSQLSPGANYIVLKTICANSLDSSYSNEIVINVNGGTITSTPANFCGVGGLATLEINTSSTYDSIVWNSLTPNATFTVATPDSVGFTVQETSDYSATIYFSSGSTCPIFGSLGVYPLPAATVTASADGVCPGTSAVINSGLSAGNFSSQSITHAPRTAPLNASVLTSGGTAITTLTGGSLDDGGWGSVPIGFGFNFFGTTYSSINVGTNGTLQFGAFNNNGGFTAPYGLADFSFTTLPSSSEPFNMIAVLAMDNNLGSADGGTIKYWTEGFSPNRKFIVSYENVKEFGDTKYSTAQAIFYETTGYIEVHVTSSTNIDRNKLVGINNGNGTVGVLAFASGTTPSATNPISNPFAYRFIPPNDYSTVWSLTDANGTSIISDSINEFSLSVSPGITTTYDISYTNLTTGCSNAPNSAQVTMSILGQIAPTGVLASASADSICFGESVTLSSDYTGSTDGFEFQWQVSADGINFIDVFGQDQLTFTSNQTSNTTYRLKMTSCGGTPSYSSNVLVSMGACYLMTNGSISVCDGVLFDSGGETGDYSSNESYTLTITPSTPGSLMQINFTSFQLETCCDDFTIYNGNSTSTPIIGTYTGNPGSITSTASDGSLTLLFNSDGSIQFGGWSATMNCVLPPSNDSTCNAITIAVDGSLNTFNNGGASVQLNEITIAPPVTGDQDISGWGDNALSATTWYKFTAPASGQIKLSGSDVEFDGQIALYNVGSCSDFATFNLVAANDNSLLDQSTAPGFTFCDLIPGNEYYIMHDSRNNVQTGEFSIRISELVVNAGNSAGIVNVCTGESVDLFDGITSEDNGGVWSQSTPTLGLNGSTFNSSGLAYQNFDFTYSVVDGCAVDSEMVTVKIYGPSNAGNGGTLTVCKNEPFNLLNALSGTVDLGGSWYDPQNQVLASNVDTAGNFPGQFNYDYIVSNGICPADTANILVIVDPSCDYLASIEELSSSISIYPNPTSTNLTIDFGKTNLNIDFQIYDIQGKEILQETNIALVNGKYEVNTSSLVPGVYMLHINSLDKQFIYRIIKH